MGEGEELPKADGPLTKVTLPDGQRLYAVVVSRRCEHDGSWWYTLRIYLPSLTATRMEMVMEPAPVTFRAPSGMCEPVEGQSYGAVPTTRHGRPDGRWRIELPWDRGDTGPDGPTRIVHRGDCRMVGAAAQPVNSLEAQIALHRDAAPCTVCRPDRALKNT